VLRRISELKRQEEAGSWRRLHNEELRNLCASPYVIRVIRSRTVGCAGHISRNGEVSNAYGILVGKPEGKIPLGRHRYRWTDMDLSEMGRKVVNWIHLVQYRDQWRAVVNTVMNFRGP